MGNVDATILKKTKYIAKISLLLSVLMQAVFLVIGRWEYTVFLGNILSASAGVINFFLMGLTVQKALKRDEKDAKTAIKLSQTYRTLFLALVLIVGFTVSCFNRWAVVIPLFFPGIAVRVHPFFEKQ